MGQVYDFGAKLLFVPWAVRGQDKMSNTVYGECTLEERKRPRVWIALVVSLLMGAMEPVLSMILR